MVIDSVMVRRRPIQYYLLVVECKECSSELFHDGNCSSRGDETLYHHIYKICGFETWLHDVYPHTEYQEIK